MSDLPREKLLKDAIEAIVGPREESYGTASHSFASIARLWNAYLTTKHGSVSKLNSTDVAMMMILLKVSRISTGETGKRDSWLDIAGYAGLGYEVSADE